MRQEPEEKAEVEQAYYHKTREERVGIRLHTIVGKKATFTFPSPIFRTSHGDEVIALSYFTSRLKAAVLRSLTFFGDL